MRPVPERLAMEPREHADRQRRRRLGEGCQRFARDLGAPAAALGPTPQRQLEPGVARIRQRRAHRGVARAAVRLCRPAQTVEVDLAGAGALQARQGRRGEYVPVARGPQHLHEPFRLAGEGEEGRRGDLLAQQRAGRAQAAQGDPRLMDSLGVAAVLHDGLIRQQMLLEGTHENGDHVVGAMLRADARSFGLRRRRHGVEGQRIALVGLGQRPDPQRRDVEQRHADVAEHARVAGLELQLDFGAGGRAGAVRAGRGARLRQGGGLVFHGTLHFRAV